jgi:hypothetical protein
VDPGGEEAGEDRQGEAARAFTLGVLFAGIIASISRSPAFYPGIVICLWGSVVVWFCTPEKWKLALVLALAGLTFLAL